MNIEIKKLKEDAIVPTYAHDTDAGVDLYSYEDIVLPSEDRCVVHTGIAVNIPKGYVGLIHSRSGLSADKGVIVLNSPGTIDAGYQGELKIILCNTDKYLPFRIKKGDRIAQMIFQKIEYVDFEIVSEFSSSSDRGEGGLGSTGI